ncbi:unnamed protein product, partial [Ectocarpus sp. 12 AP-2014]
VLEEHAGVLLPTDHGRVKVAAPGGHILYARGRPRGRERRRAIDSHERHHSALPARRGEYEGDDLRPVHQGQERRHLEAARL